MGEFSKTIGEKGEKIVDEILNLFGWRSTPINESLPCSFSDKHKSEVAKQGKSTHGTDSFYIYKSPFFTGQLDHIVISSKYTEKIYPTGSSEFKSHFKDLSFTVECYNNSALRNANSEQFDKVDGERITGLLFWLSNQKSQFDRSVFHDLNPILDSSLVYETAYIVDSCRASYLFDCIRNARSFYSDYNFEYYYIDTGNNPSDINKRYHGKELPVQLIVSDIQIFKLSKQAEVIVALFMKDNFSTDSLSRVLGLAHGIAKGWVNKINIHFPDYESSSHESDVFRIKRGFEGSGVVDCINIVSYHDTFTSLGNRDQSIDLPCRNARDIPQSFKHSQILPYGNELRDLLSRSQITTTEMNRLLRMKGVYVAEPKKENLIPILSSILLSPREFDFLRDRQKSREDTTKRSSSPALKCSKEISVKGLVNVLGKIDLKAVGEKDFCNFVFINSTLSFAQVDADPNHVKATYRIVKTENNKIWFENKNEFTASISLKLSEKGLEITPISDYTSSETELINNNIKRRIISNFKRDGLISHEVEEKKILMNEMSNSEVIKFLISFTDSSALPGIEFEEIISLDVEIDQNVPLPESSKIKWMEERVSRLKFDGTKIEDLELITKSDNHKYLKLWGMLCKFKLNSQLGKATIKIGFFFRKNSPHEFSFNIEKLHFTKETSSMGKVRAFILDEVDTLKLKKYNAIVKSR